MSKIEELLFEWRERKRLMPLESIRFPDMQNLQILEFSRTFCNLTTLA